MLAGLLGVGTADAAIDHRVALAVLQRRDRGAALRAEPAKADMRRVSAMRAEIMRLAGPGPRDC